MKPVVVTRAETQDGPLSAQLRSLGLTVLLWPATRTRAADSNALDRALRQAQEFAWIVFASRHAVAAVLQRLPKQPEGVRIAAVGQSTAQVLRQRGWQVEVVPDEAEAGGLVTALAAQVKIGTRVLYPASSRALPTIAKGLAQLGAEVTQVEAYRTEPAALDVAQCRAWIERDGVGAVTFASPSAVIELEQSLGKADLDRLLTGAPAIAMGPTTSRVLAERGYSAVMAEAATLGGLANATLRVMQTKQ
jgi:uroporphyrinogen-III synthase/uroporphyrinogen III methyltransferase/synthase